MVEVPANQITQADLSAWYTMQDELKKLRASEMLLRKKIASALFPEPKEGTNKVDLADGWVLKNVVSYTREIDPGAFQAMREQFTLAGIHPDSMVQWKPSLKTKEYRELTAEQTHLFDQCLIVKESAPALEIVLPAKNKPKAGQ